MLFRLILLVALFVAYFYCRNRLANTAKDQRKPLILRWTLWAAIAAVVFMAATGRLHWVGGLIALCVPFVRQLGIWLAQRYFSQRLQSSGTDSTDSSNNTPPPEAKLDPNILSRQDAIKLLNLEEGFSQQDLTQAHRRMMQKNHPDQGGSDYLAALINRAKEVLLKETGA